MLDPAPRIDWGIEHDQLAITIFSCDKYSDLWPSFAYCFDKAWPDCPFARYLFSNTKKFDSASSIRTILSGDDIDWSSSIRKCLQQLKEEYVLVLFDDVLLSQKVDQKRVAPVFKWLSCNKPTYLRLRPVPKPDERITKEIGRYRETTLYRTAVLGIWRRTSLEQLLVDGESAWQFECNSVARATHDPNFYGVYQKNLLPYVHGVEKGRWVPSAYQWLLCFGGPMSKHRPVMSGKEVLINTFAHLKEYFFNHAPSSFRPKLLHASRIFRRSIHSFSKKAH